MTQQTTGLSGPSSEYLHQHPHQAALYAYVQSAAPTTANGEPAHVPTSVAEAVLLHDRVAEEQSAPAIRGSQSPEAQRQLAALVSVANSSGASRSLKASAQVAGASFYQGLK